MKRALELAALGRGLVSPNPLVGAVIIKNNDVISEGYHQIYGGPHAEANALKVLEPKDSAGATLYCNLEPCCHTNKQTPPCVPRIIEAGIKTVIIANLDPNPAVAGQGVRQLQDAGIEVISGICEEEGRELNRVFFKNMETQMPYIHLKIAQTLDGKMASLKNDSKWISDDSARQQVHRLRAEYDAVAVGRNTQVFDNPKLTARLEKTTSPHRLVFGDINKMNRTGHLFTDEFRSKTIVLTTKPPIIDLEEVTIIDISQMDLETVFRKLYRDYKICSILIEGGPTLLTKIIDQTLFDRMTVYIAPIILGNGPSLYKNEDKTLISDALKFGNANWSTLNQQAVLEINHVHRTC